MKNILLFLSTVFLYTFSLKAALQTATHTYILNPDKDTLLRIDRITGIKEYSYVGGRPQSMGLYANDQVSYLFVAHITTHDLWIIDFKKFKYLNAIPFNGELKNHFIYKDWVYFINYSKSELVRMHATNWDDVTTFSFLGHPSDVGVINNFAYVPCPDGREVLKINLDTLSMEKCWSNKNTGICCPITITIYKNTPYVLDCLEGYLYILSEPEIRKIKVNGAPTDIQIENDFAYLLSTDPSGTTLSKWDLETGAEIKSVNLKNERMIRSFRVHKGRGYILDSSSLFNIDLEKFVILESVNHGQCATLDFSDTHIYLGSEEFERLQESLILFGDPYRGLREFPIGEDADKAFQAFLNAIEKKEYADAKIHFNTALCLVHPKAYALAAHAFCNGKWGAARNMQWVIEFIPGMDLNYFNELEETGKAWGTD